VAGPILDQTEIKEIFGNLPPIYEVHLKIKDRLEKLANHIQNEESVSVGQIYLDNVILFTFTENLINYLYLFFYFVL
jgi:hypothetical protein